MRTSQHVRDFYDDLYKKAERRNPAYEIYDRLRARNIADLAKDQPGPVLIVGCGSNRDLSIVTPDKKVFAFDLSFNAVKKLSANNASLFTADSLDIPCEDETFCLVICSEVLEHIPDIRSAVKELRRVVRPDGLLIVSSPNWVSWFGLARWVSERWFGKRIHSDNQPYDDWKTWSKYRQELSPEFEVIQTKGVWYLPPLHFRKYGLPAFLTRLIYFFFSPLEKWLSSALPGGGHLLVLKCKPR